MPPVELEGLRETFESIDKSHSGTISLEELTSHLQVKTCGGTTRMGLLRHLDASTSMSSGIHVLDYSSSPTVAWFNLRIASACRLDYALDFFFFFT